MISPDVNILIAASRADHVHHAIAHAWLLRALETAEDHGGLDILPVVAAGFLRLVTHPKVFPEPTPMKDAVLFMDSLLEHPAVSMSEVGMREWRQCRLFCLEKKLAANRVPDALIAGSIRVQGAKLATFDRGFTAILTPSELQILVTPR